MTPEMEALFREARLRGDIEKLSGVKRGRRGPCPVCQPGSKKGDAFSHSAKTGLWRCFKGCGGGDVIRLVEQLTGLRPAEAARHILGLPVDGSSDRTLSPETAAARVRREAEEDRRRREAARAAQASADFHARTIADLDRRAVEPDPVVGQYLWSRGIDWRLVPDALLALRGAVGALHSFDDRGREVRARAMVATIVSPATGERIGRHVTYLQPDGRGKADLDPARKVWGSIAGGVWLTRREPVAGPLFVAEGIETALSLLCAWRAKRGDHSGRALAVLSLDNLQGGRSGRWGGDRWGRLDTQFPEPDAAHPPVTWPDAGEVRIGVDHDMKPLRDVKVRKAGGGTAKVELDATTRMEVCAKLAAHAWRAAGASPVRVHRPPVGLDWNDALMAARQSEGEKPCR